jgi:hypothetical protein
MIRFFRLGPAARPEDPVWQDRPIWGEVLVAAETPAHARQLAARQFEADLPAFEALEKPRSSAGFESEKLYAVLELDPTEAVREGNPPPGVLRARLAEDQPRSWPP